MSDVLCAADEGLPLLDEVSEPLVVDPAPPALDSGREIGGGDGVAYRVSEVLREDAGSRTYSVETDDSQDGPRLWLREAWGSTVELLRHEREVCEGLNFPMFPRICSGFEAEGRYFLTCEPCNAASLAEQMSLDQTSIPGLLSILAQAASALNHLHSRGWVHGSVRPEVILPGKPTRIIDLSRATPVGERPKTCFQYAGYTAPEVASGQVDGRADIYSLGAILYEGVSGKRVPEGGLDSLDWCFPTPFGGIPQILHRCLQDDPTRRYSSMQALHAALLQLLRRQAPTYGYQLVGATNIGLEPDRTSNQDSYGFSSGRWECDEGGNSWAVFCLADGMGGMEAGDVASREAVREVLTQASTLAAQPLSITAAEQVETIRNWVSKANERVCEALAQREAKGGTTIIAGFLVGPRLTIGHVGDCRLYLLRQGDIRLLTRDHSLAMTQVLQGEAKMEDLRTSQDRSRVTRSLGDRSPLPAYFTDSLQPGTGSSHLNLEAGDVLLACSDGVWEPVLEDEMLAASRSANGSLQAMADALVLRALEKGGPDNATVVLLRMLGGESTERHLEEEVLPDAERVVEPPSDESTGGERGGTEGLCPPETDPAG